MTVRHEVDVAHVPGDDRVAQVTQAINEKLTSFGLRPGVEVNLLRDASHASLCLYFASPLADNDPDDDAEFIAAGAPSRVTIPVVSTEARVTAELPSALSGVNAFFWDRGGAGELASLVLRELGIEEQQRRVFISHKRADGARAAGQLHDEFQRRFFDPFIDRYAIRPGEDVQRKIADVLEDFAFLLLLETPGAVDSRWVLFEVQYALTHAMGVLILTWPGAKPVPGTPDVPRIRLRKQDIRKDGHLKQRAVARIVRAAEAAHANALVRRRRLLLTSVVDVVGERGETAIVLPEWRVLVDDRKVLGITPRLPTTSDLFRLDSAATQIGGHTIESSLMVHAARTLSASLSEELTWAIAGRRIRLLRENEIGGAW